MRFKNYDLVRCEDTWGIVGRDPTGKIRLLWFTPDGSKTAITGAGHADKHFAYEVCENLEHVFKDLEEKLNEEVK